MSDKKTETENDIAYKSFKDRRAFYQNAQNTTANEKREHPQVKKMNSERFAMFQNTNQQQPSFGNQNRKTVQLQPIEKSHNQDQKADNLTEITSNPNEQTKDLNMGVGGSNSSSPEPSGSSSPRSSIELNDFIESTAAKLQKTLSKKVPDQTNNELQSLENKINKKSNVTAEDYFRYAYLLNNSNKKDKNKIKKYFEESARRLDDPKTIIGYAEMMIKESNESTTKINGKEIAKIFYKRAADLGNIECMIKYAKLVNNLGNKKEALEYCEKAIDLGDTNAMLEYGRITIGNGTSIIGKKDMKKAAGYYEKAARLGNKRANAELVLLYDIASKQSKKSDIEKYKKNIEAKRDICKTIIEDIGNAININNIGALQKYISDYIVKQEDIVIVRNEREFLFDLINKQKEENIKKIIGCINSLISNSEILDIACYNGYSNIYKAILRDQEMLENISANELRDGIGYILNTGDIEFYEEYLGDENVKQKLINKGINFSAIIETYYCNPPLNEKLKSEEAMKRISKPIFSDWRLINLLERSEAFDKILQCAINRNDWEVFTKFVNVEDERSLIKELFKTMNMKLICINATYKPRYYEELLKYEEIILSRDKTLLSNLHNISINFAIACNSIKNNSEAIDSHNRIIEIILENEKAKEIVCKDFLILSQRNKHAEPTVDFLINREDLLNIIGDDAINEAFRVSCGNKEVIDTISCINNPEIAKILLNNNTKSRIKPENIVDCFETAYLNDNLEIFDLLIKEVDQEIAMNHYSTLQTKLNSEDKKPNDIVKFAMYYEYGIGIEQNQREAERLYREAAQKGNTYAMCKWADILYKKNDKKAAADQYLNIIKNDRNRYAMRKYADMLYNNDGLEGPVEKNKTEALKLYQKLIDLGDNLPVNISEELKEHNLLI